MGELIQGWEDLDDLDLFAPNCPDCLHSQVLGGAGWSCDRHDLVERANYLTAVSRVAFTSD